MKDYKKEFRHRAVQLYLHSLTGEISEHLDSITSSLSFFTDVGGRVWCVSAYDRSGIPAIKFKQKHGTENLQVSNNLFRQTIAHAS